MTLIRNYNFSENQITAFAVDSSGYLWVAFDQDASGNCAFQKVSSNNPLQKYYDIDIAVTQIKRIYVGSSYVYLAYNDDSYIGARYSLLNPLTTYTNFDIPAGITEAPVDVRADDTYIWFLIPGNTSGTNAKLVKCTLAGTYVETVDLPTITNAKSFAIDSDTGDLWIVTYTSPAKLVRVYDDGGWNITTTLLD